MAKHTYTLCTLTLIIACWTECIAFSTVPQLMPCMNHIRPWGTTATKGSPSMSHSTNGHLCRSNPLRTRYLCSSVRPFQPATCLSAQSVNKDADEAYSTPETTAGQVELSSDDNNWFTQTKDSLHISRKLFHTSGGLILAGFRVALSRETFLFFFGWLLTLTFITEFLRLNVRPVRKIVHKVFHALMRETERTRFTTTSYYQLGVVLVCAVFSLPISIVAILTLAVGDPIASFSGRTANMYLPDGAARAFLCAKTYGSKSVAGTLAFVVATFFTNTAALLALAGQGCIQTLSLASAATIALTAAVAGALAELWTNEKWALQWKRLPLSMDDNLLIPVAAACAAALAASAASIPLV